MANRASNHRQGIAGGRIAVDRPAFAASCASAIALAQISASRARPAVSRARQPGLGTLRVADARFETLSVACICIRTVILISWAAAFAMTARCTLYEKTQKGQSHVPR